MSPLSRGISNRIPNMDSILILTGASHPSISTHILIAVAFLILGLGSLETSTLLPIPLYGCRGALTLADLSGKQTCKNIVFLDLTRNEAEHQIWSCGADSWWQLTDWPGCVLSVGRLLLAIVAGLGLDIFGRKQSAVVWMGVYFTASLSRSFSPNNEVFVMAVTIEALSSQIASLALLLIATEGSIQKESVRSACHVLIGHSIGVIVFIPVINSSISSEMFRQLARSLPSIYFVLLIFFLPESIRWVVSQGKLEEASAVLQKSHKVIVDDALRSKFAAVYNDMRKCLSECRSRGNSLKQAILPIIFAKPMWRVFLPFLLISFLQGSAIGFRLIHDPMPYQSVEDRVIACGVAELLALHLLGLLLARLPVRRVLFSLSAKFAALLLLTRALKLGGYASCIADMFFSSGGHFVTITTWVWLVIGVIRITPTHCRGTVLGFVVGFATLGHALSLLVFKTLTVSLEWNEYFAALLYSGVVIVSGLLVLILPSTPFVMPDMTSHLAPQTHWTTEEIGLTEHNSRNDIDTRL